MELLATIEIKVPNKVLLLLTARCNTELLEFSLDLRYILINDVTHYYI